MQISESIEKLITTVPPDPLMSIATSSPIPLEDIITVIRRACNSKELASFDLGVMFSKHDITSSKNIIKNLISLLSEAVCKAIADSDINSNYKDTISFEIKNIINTLRQNFESHYNILTNLNINKNLLDANNITLIILGYAIGLLKKEYSN
jgi:hypothetical protein